MASEGEYAIDFDREPDGTIALIYSRVTNEQLAPDPQAATVAAYDAEKVSRLISELEIVRDHRYLLRVKVLPKSTDDVLELIKRAVQGEVDTDALADAKRALEW